MNGKKEAEKVGVTLRFDVQLAPPTDKETNEFSYIRLKEKEELKVKGREGGWSSVYYFNKENCGGHD